MKYGEAKERYLQAWGSLGSSWGVSRTMAQVHALLMISTQPVSTEEIMEELSISRGNVNMNVRALIDWGLAEKVFVPGERKEFFRTDKDITNLAVQVAKERKKRELEPILKVLSEVNSVEGDSHEVEEFRKVTTDLHQFASQSDMVLERFINQKSNWFLKILGKLTK
ncbi:MarR family transcriptional regulator [Limibacter armeniacum]|uniref:GbsR/MarR family transcriptional regulator n=1 Tax=Limibacter armeniacum TaxID=466084 RepID=UPI002FE5DCB0